ncbi:helix-turn-helix transcriptional regulator [Loktanella salsilacus]|uniref:helix-turn-helix transcriptional regulator n=1 Tax=Loktanella salsilacus TaxID=195913 RepID=UPI003988F97B
MRRVEVQAVTSLRKSMIYKLMADGQFPKSVKLTSRSVAWRSSEIIAWVAARKATTKPSICL